MQILIDAGLSLLACIGIWALGQMAWAWLLGGLERGVEACVVVRAQGDGTGLETVVRCLSRQCGLRVVVVDCGLSERGRSLAEHLINPALSAGVCSWDQMGVWMKEAEIWKRQGSTRK